MGEYYKYRLCRRKVLATSTAGNIDGRYLDDKFLPTQITFKARNESEAMGKARRFWERGEFGAGSICVIKEVNDDR